MMRFIDTALRAAGRAVNAYNEAERAAREGDRDAIVDAYNARRRSQSATKATPSPTVRSTVSSNTEPGFVGNARSDAPPLGGRPDPQSISTIAATFADRERLLGAVIMSEILSPPVSLR